VGRGVQLQLVLRHFGDNSELPAPAGRQTDLSQPQRLLQEVEIEPHPSRSNHRHLQVLQCQLSPDVQQPPIRVRRQLRPHPLLRHHPGGLPRVRALPQDRGERSGLFVAVFVGRTHHICARLDSCDPQSVINSTRRGLLRNEPV
jgi:hypothetical protein